MADVFYSSAEIRWFLNRQQDQGDAVLHWFRWQGTLDLKEEVSYVPEDVTGNFVKRERERTDEYLLFPDSDSVGVKMRQGKLEVKALVVGPRPYSLSTAGVAGRLDQWTKWSFESELRKQLEPELAKAGPWQRVQKDRYLQKYSFDSGSMMEVSLEERPKAGCNVEMTVLAFEQDQWDWLTIGFEAFGPSGRVIRIVDEAVEHFFNAHGRPPLPLVVGNSFSYPAWLTTLHKG